MKIISDVSQFHIEEKTAVAIGKFDGIHLGHVELLKHILDKKKDGLLSCVFTFSPSAASFFGGKNVKEITTLNEKRIIFENLGVDILIEYPLNNDTARISAEDFISDILVGMMNAEYVVAGDDLSFGYKGLGDCTLLKKAADELGFSAQIIDKVKYNLRDISSTFVREEIENGHMDVVNDLLGHPYSFAGRVEAGFKLGRKLGFPTMNLYPDEEKILPPLGVYYSKVYFEGGEYPGLTNIGVRPTVSKENKVSVETFLYDFDMDMYGKEIVTELLLFKRPEMQFDTVEKLRMKMHEDLEEGRRFFGIIPLHG